MSQNNRFEIRASGARTVKAIATAVALTASFSVYSQAQNESTNKQGRELSRAEVVADLALWRRAGVDRYELAHSYSLENQAYREAYQDYLRLRNSEQFQIEVQKAQKD